jgi:CHAP domain-containing protein
MGAGAAHATSTAVVGQLTPVRSTDIAVGRALASAPAPQWWNGNCDVNNHPGSYPLGAAYNGVEACGPGPYQGGYDHTVHFFSRAYPVLEWECVELVMRYMYLVYGVAPYSANGSTVVRNYTGTVLKKVSNNGSSLPSPGDIISEGAASTNGHTGVVTKVNVSGGTGTVTMMEENATAKGWATIKVSGNILGSRVTGWLEPAQPAQPKLLATITLTNFDIGPAQPAGDNTGNLVDSAVFMLGYNPNNSFFGELPISWTSGAEPYSPQIGSGGFAGEEYQGGPLMHQYFYPSDTAWSHENFPAVAAMLTNGVDDNLVAEVVGLTNGTSTDPYAYDAPYGGNTLKESAWIPASARIGTAPDLKGHTITMIHLEVQNLHVLQQPGGTEITGTASWLIYGT